MIISAVAWYLVISLVGWLVFPLAYRLLRFLPDRGLNFSRPLGLLLCGYIFWLLVSLQLLQNDVGGVFFAVLAAAGLSGWVFWKNQDEILPWLRENRRVVVMGELLFLLLFAAWTLFRAAVPDASGTEKPMELAFINAILRSPSFPPSDPWLSGYSISYYYFGYVIVAMVARLAGVPGAVAFNLAIASCFALAGMAAYGLLYNLLSLRYLSSKVNGGLEHVQALLAPLFLLLVSNLEGFLELLYARGVFAQTGFWQWLNIQEINQPPVPPFGWEIDRPGGIWWWRASRVLQDFDFNFQPREIIDEFPMFSFLLGDLHPHVLAMPFGLLAAGLALNGYLRFRESSLPSLVDTNWLRSADFWSAAMALGALSFLNTWDFPIYLALFTAAVVLARYLRMGLSWQLAFDFLITGVAVGLAGILLFLPFYLGFSSQANGLVPSMVFFTRGVYFWVMFAPLLLPVFAWLIWQWLRGGSLQWLARGFLFGAGITGGLWLLSSLLGLVAVRVNPSIAGVWNASPDAPIVLNALIRRFQSPGTWLSLLALITLTWGLIRSFYCAPHAAGSEVESNSIPQMLPAAAVPECRADAFVLLIILLGAGLVLFPEFLYLRDQFGWRMNTIFKFYFQAWILWSVAAAYATVVCLREVSSLAGQVILRFGFAALIVAGLVYPAYGIPSRAGRLSQASLTLDGSNFLERSSPGEMEAIRWLQIAPYGVVAEAVGGSYSGYARVSTYSGMPSVLGWPGHESQWRGGWAEMGSREPDINELYSARQWSQARQILEKYHIRYVFVGRLERDKYRLNLALFDRYLSQVFSNDEAIIYEVPEDIWQQEQVVQQ